MNAMWISWHDHPRSRALASRLAVPLRAYSRRRTGSLRHVEGFLWTILVLVRDRPRLIFLQNSFLLLLLCGVYRWLTPGRTVCIIVDCHNKSLKRDLGGPLGPLFRGLKRWSFQQCGLAIVSNELLLERAALLAPRAVVLRDPLPIEYGPGSGSETASTALPGLTHPYALFVCSFEADEPIATIFGTSRLLPERGIQVVITGDSHPWAVREGALGLAGIQLPGFVDNASYRALLCEADVVVVLTMDTDCLVCGAYEAIAADRPLVLSDTPLLREVFGDCADYSTHDPAALARTIERRAGVPSEDRARSRARFESAFDHEWMGLVGAIEAAASEAGVVFQDTKSSGRDD